MFYDEISNWRYSLSFDIISISYEILTKLHLTLTTDLSCGLFICRFKIYGINYISIQKTYIFVTLPVTKIIEFSHIGVNSLSKVIVPIYVGGTHTINQFIFLLLVR